MRPLITGLLYSEDGTHQWNDVDLKQWFSKLVGSSGEREVGRGNIGVWDEDVQTIVYKISYKDILYSTGNIADIL